MSVDAPDPKAVLPDDVWHVIVAFVRARDLPCARTTARALRRGADELPTLPQLEMTAAIVPGGAQALWRRLDDAGSRRVDPGCIGRGRDGTGADPLDVMRMLRASPEALGTARAPPATAAEWRSWARTHRELLAALSAAPSPGCEYQKYLRWAHGLPAASPRFVAMLLGVSALAQGAPDEANFPALTFLFSNGKCWARLPQVSVRAYLALLAGVVTEHRLLRLVLAQCHQIACRAMPGHGKCLLNHPRQQGAYKDLVAIATHPEREHNYWA